MFCTSWIFTAVSGSEWPPNILPRFPLGQKRREHVQEALVKETVLNDEVESPEQRGVLSVGRGVCYTTVIWTYPYKADTTHASPEEEPWGWRSHTKCFTPHAFLFIRNRLYYHQLSTDQSLEDRGVSDTGKTRLTVTKKSCQRTDVALNMLQ